MPIPDKVAIVIHSSKNEDQELADEILSFAARYGIDATAYDSLYDEKLNQHVKSCKVDMLIAAGGDGTMLRAGHICSPCNVPIFGINLGRFGFLPEVKPGNWREMLLHVFEGDYWLEERMMLQADHCRRSESGLEETLGTYHILNEIVVCRGDMVRPVYLEAAVDGYKLASYVADGLIASTPTGSTAYALAVGGPIMPPDLSSILIIPVAPHLSVDRAVILPADVKVTISAITDHQVVLSADGQSPVMMESGDYVNVKVGDHKTTFVRFFDKGYFYRKLTMYMEQNPATHKNLRNQ